MNYNRSISVVELEKVSCYSYRNLQRVFFAVFKETIGGYQTRLKVENGYKQLLYTKKQISVIAVDVGFSDIHSFSKTFKKYFGFSPLAAKKKKELLFKEINLIHDIAYQGEPEIVFMPAVLVNYISCRTNYINPEIESLWSTFLNHSFEGVIVEYFGVISDDITITKKGKCNYDACVLPQKLNKELPIKEIFGRNYAKFIHYGSFDKIEETYTQIYGGWMLGNQLEFSHLPIIEQYIKHDSNSDSEVDFITAILIPLL
ncbi:AraC family transcriptional regulator [Flavobacterium collinsii]|uniref:AraC family transcriptional regulator n=1 Tax=Flavobacterium collinsii TaxID=1114861 RepID=UPI0021E08C6A|nr:GyrI-like domain-containing protein [Flavobacterium collinsii]